MDSEDFPNFAIENSDENRAEQIEKKMAENSCFAILHDNDLKELVASAESKSTKKKLNGLLKPLKVTTNHNYRVSDICIIESIPNDVL